MTLMPYLFYEDVPGAAEWLQEAFGFTEIVAYRDERNEVTYELSCQGSSVMIGHFGRSYRNPRHTGHISQLLYMEVKDVDAHCARAAVAGAMILDPLADKPFGIRQYIASDPEGHRWGFGQPVRDVLPEEMERVSVST
jgi:uncharacterized glyoxalase superfamily protein PhnB